MRLGISCPITRFLSWECFCFFGAVVSNRKLNTPVLDKFGESLAISSCDASDLYDLIEMYESFSPRPASLGLPPEDNEICRRWVHGILRQGENFVARKEGKIVGHTALLPGPDKKDAELILFISLPYRSRGLGLVLTKTAMARAEEIGVDFVWLTVESFNMRAVALYQKFGFKFCDEGGSERLMIALL
jgi:GNAT superfamily N-acetyltransferase